MAGRPPMTAIYPWYCNGFQLLGRVVRPSLTCYYKVTKPYHESNAYLPDSTWPLDVND
jgi:hypothetical protein